MFKTFLKSLNGKILCTIIPIYLIGNVCGPLFEIKELTVLSAFIVLFLGVWPWISSKKSSIIFLSWFFRNKMPIELVSFDNDRYYTLADKLEDGCSTCPVYFASNIGQVKLCYDGTVDAGSKSSYIKHWIPLNKSDRVQHILTYGIPELE